MTHAAPPRSSSSARWPPRPPTASVVFVTDSSEANLRWAANSLTTNGAMRSRHVVVVSFVDGGAGHGRRHRRTHGDAGRRRAVAASEQAARDAGPAEDAVPLVSETPAGRGRLGRRAGRRPRSRCSPSSRPPWARPSARPRDRGELLFGFAEHSMATDLPRDVDRPAAAARPAHRPGRAQRQEPRLLPLGVGRAPAPATSGTSSVADLAADVQRKMGWSQRRSSCRPAGTRRCCRPRRSAT